MAKTVKSADQAKADQARIAHLPAAVVMQAANPVFGGQPLIVAATRRVFASGGIGLWGSAKVVDLDDPTRSYTVTVQIYQDASKPAQGA